MECNFCKVKKCQKIEKQFVDFPLNPITINKVRSILLLTVDAGIPNNLKKGNNLKIHFHETIISPIKIKYFSYSSLKIKNPNEPVKRVKEGNNEGFKNINFKKISFAQKKFNHAGFQIDKKFKYSEIISPSKKELVKNGLVFLHNLAIRFRKVISNLNISDKNDSAEKKPKMALHLALIPCGSSNNIFSNQNSSLKCSHTTRFNWADDKIVFESPSTESPFSKRPISEDFKTMNFTKAAINQEVSKQNLNEERSKLTFLNFHPNEINKNGSKSKILGKPPIGKKIRRKTEQTTENYVQLGESKICNSPMNSRIIIKQNY